ncbi:MAG: cytochrome c [Planctomycetes bacterium]|nr:cytochrome c [Planctomycetota bacterium]
MQPRKRARALLPLALVSAALLWLCPGSAQAQSAAQGQAVFKEKCTACHTIGSGKLVGPDLAGVTTRRPEEWLFRQIKEPQVLIAEKDPVVMELLAASNNVQMVPLGLLDDQIRSVIEYLKSTEGHGPVDAGVPAAYVPTVLVSLLLLVGLTTVGLTAGSRKRIDGNRI